MEAVQTVEEEITAENMTAEQADEILAKAFATPEEDKPVEEPAPTDNASEPAPEAEATSEQSDTGDNTPAESVSTPADELAKLKAQYDESERKRKSYDGIVQKTLREKAELEEKMRQYDRLNEMVTKDPRVAQMMMDAIQGRTTPQVPGMAQPQMPNVPQDFDYTNPQHVAMVAAQAAQQAAQQLFTQRETLTRQQQQVLQQREFNANVELRKAQLAADLGVDMQVIDDGLKKLMGAFQSGDIARVAHVFSNHDSEITAAEARGAAKERERIAKLKDLPKRTGSVSSGTPQVSKHIDLSSADITSAEFERALEEGKRLTNFS